jgi:uncharacterized protein with PIN domain
MPAVFTLSVHRPWAAEIAAGRKHWEFRANPDFGRREGLAPGDALLIVAMDEAPEIIAWAQVLDIIREDDLSARFGDPALSEYRVALHLAACALPAPIACAQILRRGGERAWGGQGFGALAQLYRYTLHGEPVEEALRRLIPALPWPAPAPPPAPVEVTFYGALRELPGVRARMTCAAGNAKDLIEALGVPHPEVDALCIDGQPADFGAELSPCQRLEVWPYGEGPPEAPRLIPAWEGPPRFVVDVHLTALARHLRLLGLDVADPLHVDDAVIAQQSADERRILLTRDLGLLKRGVVAHGLWVRDKDPEEQARQILARYVAPGDLCPMTRCLLCNGALSEVARAEVLPDLPEAVKALETPFYRCGGCHKVYWQGTHLQGLLDRLQRLT